MMRRIYVATFAVFLAAAMFLSLRAGDTGPLVAVVCAVALVVGYRLPGMMGR